jgi:hypothetical protein
LAAIELKLYSFDFQLSETDKGIEILNLRLFKTHLNDLRYVLHGFIYGLAPGMTALEERAANYISAVLVDFNENW